MLTTRMAHTLLAQAGTHDGVRALVRAIGFAGAADVLGARAVMRMVRQGGIRATRISRNAELAVLLLEQVPTAEWRVLLHRAVHWLDRLADARRWLVVVQCAECGPVSLACWLSTEHGPRLAVLTCDPQHVLDSDAQTIAALAASWHDEPSLTCVRWHDVLGRHAIGKRFFRAMHGHVAAIADGWPAAVAAEDRRTLALIHVARLLFLKFLESKGWLNGDRAFLVQVSEAALERGGRLSQTLLAPLTFGTLNTPRRQRAPLARAFGDLPFLNGGLFACSRLERRYRAPAIADELLAPLLLDTLARFRFTAREESASWSEAAIDPDLLGRTFEALMDPGERRGSGTFYTPSTLVTTLVNDALRWALPATDTWGAVLAGAVVSPSDADALRRMLTPLRVLDPACGSGSLLVAMLERLSALHQQLGDHRPIAAIRRRVLTQSVFGVDIAPMAVWLCELRLWLSVVIDDDTSDARAVLPLPNLDHHIRIGDSLGCGAFDAPAAPTSVRLSTIRDAYARSAGARKRHWAMRMEATERAAAIAIAEQQLLGARTARTELLRAARARTLFGARAGLTAAARRQLAAMRTQAMTLRRTLRRLRDGGAVDFDFRTHFADAATAGGFDIVIGNPPWVRAGHLDAMTRARLRSQYAAVTRHVREGVAFGVQTDLAIPFTQRALALARPGGVVALLLPSKLWRSVAAGALRAHLLAQAHLRTIRDYGDDASGFAAAVYPSSITLQRPFTPSGADRMSSESVEGHATDASGTTHAFTVPLPALPASPDVGAPWMVVPQRVRAAADCLTQAGVRWSETSLPTPTLGVKTGCNDAFLLGADDVTPGMQPYAHPVCRGDQVRPWHTPPGTGVIVVPYSSDGRVLPRLPAALATHFGAHERALTARTDLRPREPWWTLFRTELLASHTWRVIWADIGRTLRACVLAPHRADVPLNTCYGLRLADPVDALALTALLNAPTTTAWLSLVAEPARGGYRRFMGWTVQALPLPPWDRARALLAPVAARARRGHQVSVSTLHQATLEAYGVRHASVAPLLEWTSERLRTEPSAHQHAS
jgi:hypothetical protein